jgi:RNA recognition motif-containing protein
VTEAVLKAEIERFTGDSSSVAAVRIAMDLETGRKKGFGYVDIFKKEVAAKVIIMMIVMIMMIRMMIIMIRMMMMIMMMI